MRLILLACAVLGLCLLALGLCLYGLATGKDVLCEEGSLDD